MIVITEKQILGIFKSVVVLSDRLVCDGAELPFSVIGTYEISEDDSLLPPMESVKTVPEQIAMWQARDIMIKYNFLDDVMLFIDNIPDPVERKRAQSKFEFSNTIKRNDPLLNYVATRAGYSKSQIDDWFIEGDAL